MTKKNRRLLHAEFVRVPRWWFQGKGEQGAAWKRLPASAKLLYLYLKSGFNGTNNGRITMPYSRLKGHRGLSSPGTVSGALKELEKAEFVKRTKQGGLYERGNEYSLNGKMDPYL